MAMLKARHNRTYDNETVVKRMVREQKAMRVPSELVPYCPLCGAPMSMNLRADSTFVEDAGWDKAAKQVSKFFKAAQGAAHSILGTGRWRKYTRNHQISLLEHDTSECKCDIRLCQFVRGRYSCRNQTAIHRCLWRYRRRVARNCAARQTPLRRPTADNPLSALPRASVASASVRRTPLSAKPNGPQPQAIV